MCSSAGDIEDITSFSREIHKKISKEFLQKCKKCGEMSSILLQKKDPFCKSCFFLYCVQKFRSTIGKSKDVRHKAKVLLACSGGRKSAALLDMTKESLKSASGKQLCFIPAILFIDDSFITSDMSTNAQTTCILKILQNSGYPLLYSSLEMVCQLNTEEELCKWVTCHDFTSDIFPANYELKSELKENFNSISLSSKIVLLNHLRLLLTTEIAHRYRFDCIFVGDTTSSLAVELLSDVALGRGSQISSDTSFCDTRFKVKVCRPLREFLNEEIALYNHFNCTSYEIFPDFLTKTSSNSSVQRLTESFLSNLQESFPATIFTVFRTGGKLSRSELNMHDVNICVICKSELDNKDPHPCSALEALKISEKLSGGSSHNGIENNDTSREEFMQNLCHGCSVTFKNMPKAESFHSLLPEKIEPCVKMERNEMKEEIKEFLLEEKDEDIR